MTVLKGSHVIVHVECCEVRELKSLVVGTQECLNGNGYMCKTWSPRPKAMYYADQGFAVNPVPAQKIAF